MKRARIPDSPPLVVPVHYMSAYFPNGQQRWYGIEVPIAKLTGRWWCKYCDRIHRHWWLMRQEAYPCGDDDVAVLCAWCWHTTMLYKDPEDGIINGWGPPGIYDPEEGRPEQDDEDEGEEEEAWKHIQGGA